MNINLTSRRQFIAALTSFGLGVSIIPAELISATVAKTRAEHVIYLYMEGGMSHIDTFDPKENDLVRGSFVGKETIVPGLKLNQNLIELGKRADKMAVIRSMSVKTGAHEQAQYMARTSYNQIGTIVHPHLGSWIAAIAPDNNGSLPNDVTINAPSSHPNSGWMSKRFSPLSIPDPLKGLADATLKDLGQFNKRVDILQRANKMRSFGASPAAKQYVEFYDDTIRLLNSKDLDIFDLSKEPESIRAKYGSDKFSQGCLLARRLIQYGKVNFVEVNHGGWDTHSDNFNQLNTKLPVVDNAVGALIDDLQANGLLKKTLIVITTEFGRTPEPEGTGRGHHPKAYSSVLIGAGIRGGAIYGTTDDRGATIVDKPATVEDFNATILAAMGLNWETKLVSPEGRPFTPVNRGQPILEVLA